MQTALGSWPKYRLLYVQLRLFLLIITAVSFLLEGCATTSARKKTAPVTVAEILQMSKDKVPPDEMIKKMHESGTVYRLKASELAKLKEEGVPDKVINYMQKTYIDAVRRHQYLEDWSYWTMGPDNYWYGGGPFGWPDEYFLGP
jgi:hypothetical protein